MRGCVIHGCSNEGTHTLGVRCRRRDTTAVWAPNTGAYLCDEHATQGMQITLILAPTDSGTIRTRVLATDGNVEARTTPIADQG